MTVSLVAVVLFVLTLILGIAAAVRRSRMLGLLAAAVFVLCAVYVGMLAVVLSFSQM